MHKNSSQWSYIIHTWILIQDGQMDGWMEALDEPCLLTAGFQGSCLLFCHFHWTVMSHLGSFLLLPMHESAMHGSRVGHCSSGGEKEDTPYFRSNFSPRLISVAATRKIT